MRSATAPAVLLMLLLAIAPLQVSPLARAETARGRIGVSVTVVRPAMMRSKSIPSDLVISTADLRRGYLERHRAAQLFVENSGPVAFAIDLLPAAPLFSQVQIGTLGGRIATFGVDGGQLLGSLGGRSPGPLVLDVRFKLTPGIEPGRYPWPLRLEMRLDY